jgi:ATP-binding cassette subfamily B protein
MVGHRTYVAQTPPDRRHEREDEMLADYTAVSDSMDKTMMYLVGLASRGWLLVGLVGLIPDYLAGSVEVTAVAISVGGILSAELALRKIGQSIVHLAGAAIAWEQIAHLFQAATRPQPDTGAATALTTLPANDQMPLLDSHNLTFSYPDRGAPILQGCHLRLYQGERLVVTGPSGGGKSTLAAVIAGLRQSPIGSLRLWGLSQQALSLAVWRRSVVCTPQFHENYVLGSTFLFNLLLGQNWPPRKEDVAAAEAICTELGLNDLLNRMPAGMQQTVGEIGWQLSHGERSRLYLARTLLQGAEITVLDESFASLDPESMKRTLDCVLRHAHTLIVLAHF